MKKFRLISILLALMLLASCGGEGTATGDTTPSDTTANSESGGTDELAAPELPEKDYDGYEFKILNKIEGFGIYNNEHFVVEEENGEVLNDAIYGRNRLVEEQFNVVITEVITKNTVMNDVATAVMAGDDSYDLAVIYSAPTAYATDYLVDFNTLDYVNLDRPWWDQNYQTATSMNGKLTTAVNSMMITHMDSVLAMLYNQRLADEFKVPDLYQIVRDGKWTLAKWAEVSKNVTIDLNGDGVYDDNDQYAFVGLDGIGRLGSGIQLGAMGKDKDDLPVLNIDDPKLVEKISKLRDFAVTYEREIYDPRKDSNTGGDGDRAVFRMFLNSQTLFYVHGLGAVQQFRDMKDDFGVLPTPKLDEAQESYFISPDLTKCLGIPATASDTERTAIIVEAMAYEGYTYLRPRYYDSMLQSKYLRDEESIEMMDEYIYTNIGFSPVSGGNTLGKTLNTAKNGDGEIASTLAA
ncbi:MAG: hypothetical protein IJF67_09030, partial [Clostridia bacterium]|nr:hypothetical protein [Clostridia bacterium]